MEEGYPFSGTGNLYRFVQGLISIHVLNNVVVLFDNDAEGVASYQRCCQLNTPNNMSIITLPNLDEFRNFPTIGPEGTGFSDINGRAASIECYLDLKDKGVIRWNSYNSHINEYQGVIEEKDHFKRKFLNQRSFDKNYNYKNIKEVLDLIVATCADMAEKQNIADLEQDFIRD